ncbi:hypothetical protein HEP73_01378 [Xanthomonas sp. GW]|uniref:EF-hand domain-containing protein n=1 Tax=Xanthomonas sp. GW TaxID=2724121 RepID=UPI00163950ED|nr:EF-hand domain-containing protein [Xanthomonas sp. GW]QNH20478.1 hypothetical protein HEP73_01378 [Xanthomonas sp. GW]
MILKGRFTRRRKVLLAVVILVLAWVGYAWYAGIAITQGIEQRDMDWNGDGQVSRSEIAQAFYAIGVTRTQDGPRQCSTFYWRNSGAQIRVDCRTTFAPAADAKKPAADAKK